MHRIIVKRYYVPHVDATTGRRTSVPVTTRTLHVTTTTPDVVTRAVRWRVVAYRRGGEWRFTTHYTPLPTTDRWGRAVPPAPERRETEPNGKPSVYDTAGIVRWLRWRVDAPTAVLDTLLTAPPTAD